MLRGIAIAALLLVAIGAAALILFRPHVEVPIPETVAEREIAKRLPVAVSQAGFDIVVRTVAPDFLAGDAARVIAVADVSGYGLSGTATADATSGLTYRDGAFYLSGLRIEDLGVTVGGESLGSLGGLGAVADALLGGSREGPAGDGAGMRDPLGAALGDALDRHVLQRIPVYRLDAERSDHAAARMALVDIRFTETEAIARLDPGGLLLWAVSGASALAAIALVLLGPAIRAWLRRRAGAMD